MTSRVPPDSFLAEQGRRLQRELVRLGWNQSELARQAGIGRDNISLYIRGKVTPGPLHLNAIAKALGVEAAHIVPTRRPRSTVSGTPTLEVRDAGNGQAWLTVNQLVSWPIAHEVTMLIQRSAPAGAASKSTRKRGQEP